MELAIGTLFILGRERPWGRVGLALSIGWGLIVWVIGEGTGSLLAGPISALTGGPGAALIYVVGASLLFLPVSWWRQDTIVPWTRRALGGFWLLAALFQAQPSAGYWTSMGLGMLFQAAAAGPQPAVLATPIAAVAALAAHSPIAVNTFLVVVMATLGLAIALGGSRGWVYGLGFGWLALSWWLGQDFGALFSGMATDPSTAVPLALLTLAVAPRPHRWRSKAEIADFRSINPVALRPYRVPATSQATRQG